MSSLSALNSDVTRIARLETIDFSRLLAKDPSESAALLRACVVNGFFYLDLTTSELGRDMVKTQGDVLEIVKPYFDEPLPKKSEDPQCVEMVSFLLKIRLTLDVSLRYVPMGAYAGVKLGSRDSYERLSFVRFQFSSLVPEANCLWSDGPYCCY